MQPKMSCLMGDGGVGYVIFNLHLGVGHSVLCQMEGVGHVFSNHHILKCFGSHPPPVLFDQSLSPSKGNQGTTRGKEKIF